MKIKKITAMLICTAMLLALLPMAAFGAASGTLGADGSNISWTLTDDGKLTISGAGRMDDYIYSWNNNWLSAGIEIKSVTIENGVTSLSGNAFSGCASLAEVSLPSSLTVIGSSAFEDCTALEEIDLPEALIEIGSAAFSGTALTKIEIPASVEKIGIMAFADCTALEDISLPDGVVIERAAFDNTAYTNNEANRTDGALYIGTALVSVESDSIGTSYTIRPGTTSLAARVFEETALTEVNIPETVTVIGEMAFYKCASLAAIKLPAGLQRLGYAALRGCAMLEEVEIPSGITEIAESLFQKCTSLKKVVLPNNLTSIGSSAFNQCKALAEIDIPSGVKSIGSYAFAYCYELTELELPEGLLIIDSNAFYSCSKLAKINIPSTVTEIDTSAFYNCAVEEVELPAGLTTIGGSVFAGCYNLTKVSFPEALTQIGYRMFYYCTSLAEVDLPESLETIDGYAFYGTALSEIAIPASVTSIGSSAIPSAVKIFGYSDSAAETYANSNGNEFEALGTVEVDEVRVTTATELVAAIGSNRIITLADGIYTISCPLELNQCSNLTITAENSGKAEILSTDGYYPVVTMEGCAKVKLDGLILGHDTLSYEYDGCGGGYYSSGYVVEVNSSADITCNQCDLYGCGTVGVVLYSSDFTADGCVIRDCKECVARTYYSSTAVFNNCVISGNAYDSYYASTEFAFSGYSFDFNNCIFLNNKNTSFSSTSSTYLTDCIFSANAWDYGVPINSGICLNGITWEVNDDVLYLGYPLYADDGTVIYSETGTVLPYSESSVPWKDIYYYDIELADGVEYIAGGGGYDDEEVEVAYLYPYVIDSGEVFVELYVENLPVESNVISVGIGADGSVTAVSEVEYGYMYTTLPKGTETVKIFVWESLESMKPLCQSVEESVLEL